MLGQVAPFRFNNQFAKSSTQTVTFKQKPLNKALNEVSDKVDEFIPKIQKKNTQSLLTFSPRFWMEKLGFSQEFNSFEGVW